MVHARERWHVSSVSYLVSVSIYCGAIAAVCTERQHHLLSRSIYSVNYIYLCLRYIPPFVRSRERQLHFYISFCLFLTFSYRSLLIPRSWTRFCMRSNIARKKNHSPPACVWYCQIFIDLFEADGKFSIRTTFLRISLSFVVHRREITLSLSLSLSLYRHRFSSCYMHARTLHIHTTYTHTHTSTHRLFISLGQLLQSHSAVSTRCNSFSLSTLFH